MDPTSTGEHTGAVSAKVSINTEAHVLQRANGSVMLASPTQPEVFMLAAIDGRLTRTAEGLLAVGRENDQTVLRFPYGTELADDGQSVDVPGLGAVRLGDAIRGGGGYADVADLPAEYGGVTALFDWQAA